jgi:hypothetical protein
MWATNLALVYTFRIPVQAGCWPILVDRPRPAQDTVAA